jgi:hypothetical protein
MTLVKLGSMTIKTGQCSLCNSYTTDLLKHYILSCTDLLEIRTEMFYKIVDMLIVEDSVCLLKLDKLPLILINDVRLNMVFILVYLLSSRLRSTDFFHLFSS